KQPLEQALADLLSTQISFWTKKNKAASPASFIIYHKGLTEAVCANEISSLRHTIGKTTKQSLSSIDKVERNKTIHSGAMITRSRNGAKTWEFLVQCHQPQRMEEKASLPPTLNASKATLPTRYTILYDEIFTTPKAKVELEDLTHDMQYLFGSSTAATSDTLPIHYLGLLRKRMELFLQPWYRPKKNVQKGRAPSAYSKSFEHNPAQHNISGHQSPKQNSSRYLQCLTLLQAQVILKNSQEESITKRSPSITSFTSYNWRQDLSSSEILEHNLESFDFLLSRLLPPDSPDFPTRIIPHLDPGCPHCHTWQAHPLPKYEQYYHDMRDFSALLSARQCEWTELSHEIAGHDDWFCAFEMSRGLRELDSKLMVITFETKWPEHGDGKGDGGLGALFREAHARVKSGTWRLSANREMGWEDLEDL
ncbi:MAG: hypothetical protein L6R42_006911, partial [Xanthoria sp. 1 TBL-2021]